MPIRYLLTDNGSEFMKNFESELDRHHITHWRTYPRSPKMNAHCERFNRTIQESFIDHHEDLLFTDLDSFNQKLADWLVFYNTERPHQALALLSHVQSLITNQLECQRLWAYTSDCFNYHATTKSHAQHFLLIHPIARVTRRVAFEKGCH